MSGEALALPAIGPTDGEITLAPYRADDAERVLVGVRDPEVARFASVSWAGDSVEQLVERIETGWPRLAHEGRSLSCAIRSAETESWLGHFVFFGVDRRLGRCEVGFWLPPESRGRGLAARAVALGCAFAFGDLGLARVQATTYVDNVASQRTLEKAGFQREGLLRSYFPTPAGGRTDCFMYARLSSG